MRGAGVAFAMLLALAIPGSAPAFSWEEPTRFDIPALESHIFPSVFTEQTAMNAAGVVHAGWMANTENLTEHYRTHAATRAATGAWSAPQLITDQAPNNWNFQLLDVEVEPDGDGVALLLGPNPSANGMTSLYLSRKPHGGEWSAPMLASSNEVGYIGYEQTLPKLAVDGSGNVVVFYRFTGATLTLRRLDWDTDAPLTAPTNTTLYTSPDSPSTFGGIWPESIDLNDSGGGIATFNNGDDNGHVYAVTKGSTGGWSGLTKVTSTGSFYGSTVGGVDANGNAHVIIQGDSLREATKPAAGSWSSVTDIPHLDAWGAFEQLQPSAVHLAPDGKAVFAISRGADQATEWATMAYSGGAWSAPVLAPITGLLFSGADIHAVIDSSGNQHVAWVGPPAEGSSTERLWATRRPSGGSFSTPELIDQQAASNHGFYIFGLHVDADGEPGLFYRQHDALMGTRGGEFPKAQVTPTSVDFGSLEVGAPASTKTVKFKNTGDAVLDVTNVQLNGPFTRNDPDCDDLAPGESCEFQLSFQATDTSPKTGSLVLTHNAKGSPTTVPLTGTGHTPPGTPQLNAAELHFGTRQVGSVFPEPQFQGLHATLTNAGGGPIHINQVTIPHPFEATNPVGCDNLTLPANHSCTLFVRFRPTNVGEFVEQLSFLTDDPASPHRITLRGTGAPAPDNGGGGGNNGGAGDSGPSPQEAGTNDAREAAAGQPSSVSASAFQKDGLKIPLDISFAPAQVNGQADGIVVSPSNIIGQGATNIIASDGVSLIGQAGTNLIGQAGTNKLALRAAQSSRTVKCPSKILKKNKRAKCKQVVLISGNLFLPIPGQATLTVKPTSTFNKALKQAIAYAKAQKKKGKKGKKVTPFKLELATIVRPGGPTAPGYYQPKALTIKP